MCDLQGGYLNHQIRLDPLYIRRWWRIGERRLDSGQKVTCDLLQLRQSKAGAYPSHIYQLTVVVCSHKQAAEVLLAISIPRDVASHDQVNREAFFDLYPVRASDPWQIPGVQS